MANALHVQRCIFTLFIFQFALCIASKAQPIEARLTRAAEEVLLAHYPDHAGRLEVRFVRASIPADSTSPVQIRFPAGDTVPRGRVQAGVLMALPDGGWIEEGWAQFYVAHFDSVALPARTLTRDSPVGPGDLDFAWMETTRFAGEPLTPERYGELVSQPHFANRHLAAGKALQTTDVRPAYAARTGDPVEMIYRRDRLVLLLKGQARGEGYVGDIVRFYAPSTQTMYKVRLTGPGAAEWIETLNGTRS